MSPEGEVAAMRGGENGAEVVIDGITTPSLNFDTGMYSAPESSWVTCNSVFGKMSSSLEGDTVV